MTFLLDTNVLSELRKPGARPSVREWVAAQPASTLMVSVITVMEIEVGVLRVERRDQRQGRKLRAWLEERVLTGFRGRVVPIDLAVARRAARLHVPDRGPGRDTLIAATALVHDLTLVTRNIKDFQATGTPVLNPWQ